MGKSQWCSAACLGMALIALVAASTPLLPMWRPVTEEQCRALSHFTCNSLTDLENMRLVKQFQSTYVVSGTEGVPQFACHTMDFIFRTENSGRKITTEKSVGEEDGPLGFFKFTFNVPESRKAEQLFDNNTSVWVPFSYTEINGMHIVLHCYGENFAQRDYIVGVKTSTLPPSKRAYQYTAKVLQCLGIEGPLDSFVVPWNTSCSEPSTAESTQEDVATTLY